MTTLLIKNIGLLQTPTGSYSHRGKEQGKNLKLRDAAILIEDGMISEITCDGRLPGRHDGRPAADAAAPHYSDWVSSSAAEPDQVIDADGALVTPGLVDGHTHMVFGGYRQHEIPLKLKGAGYLDILRAGGGIMDTVRKTREAAFDELCIKTQGFLDQMMSLGVTSCEAKSGYGLDLETELKMLRVIRRMNDEHPMDICATFMPAHAVEEKWKGREDEYIRLCCEEMMPQVRRQGLADYVDIFTEDSVFNADQSRTYLEKARELGFKLRIHADEIEAIGGSVLAGQMKAVSAEHLIKIDEAGLGSMSEGGVTAMCLPATSFYLGADFAPVRRMIDEFHIPVATATDFNPGSCPSLNLQFVMNLDYLRYRMTPEEILTAVTINPACAIGMGEKTGTLEPGKQADLVIWNAQDMEMLCYRFGSNMAKTVIKKGNIV